MKRKRSPNNDIVPNPMPSSCPPPTEYDVFLSFRGEDTRDNFTSHLRKEFSREKILTFIDDRLEKGKEISPDLLDKIQKSKIYVIIFSKDYASSTWCLDELVKILECKDKYGRTVIPVFYNVDPSNIRKQSGSFKNSFIKHEQRFKNNMDKVQRWKDALTQTANLSGWDSMTTRPESKLVEEIVEGVSRELRCNSSYSLEGLVGIGHHILQMEKLLSLESPKVRIVGIWGTGGVGKTTLAQVLFQKLKAKFESCSFIPNAREQLTRTGLDQLQNKCLSELLDDGDIDTYNIRSSNVKNKLQHKKILLVLDDIDNYIQVEYLIQLCDWFGQRSRIIITSRDLQVLRNATAYRTYHVQEMNFHDALQLFRLKAFKQNEPIGIFVELSKRVVNYCQGIPLALTVLGCFLYGKSKKEWKSVSEKLKEAPHKEIFNVFKISFDGLDDRQKNIFLDLACFFGERYNPFMKHIGDFYDFPIDIEIHVLVDRSLISVKDDVIIMHDLLRGMGREIAYQQISEPRKSIRLWKHEDVYHVFKTNKDAELIYGISLDMCSIKNIHLKANSFQKMQIMRFLKFYKLNGRSNLFLSEDLDILPEELRYLDWECYPLSYIPLQFCAENLVELIMPSSRIEKLWDGDLYFPGLKRINLQGSERLVELPDLSQTPNLETIYLFGCRKLVHVRSSIILPKLRILGLDNCNVRRRVNLAAGNNNGITLRLGAIYNCFDLGNFSLLKVIIKIFASNSGKFSGFKFKAEWAPFTEILASIDTIESVESRSFGQHLASLLPFVSKLRWLDTPIDFGNFEMHFSSCLSNDLSRAVKTTNLRWEMTQLKIEHEAKDSVYNLERLKIVEEKMTSPKIIKLEQSLTQSCMKESKTKEVALSLEGWVRDFGRAEMMSSRVPKFELEKKNDPERAPKFDQEKKKEETKGVPKLTRILKSIRRWSLLTALSLQKSDIISVTWSIPGLSTLKSIAECDSIKLQPIANLIFSMNKGMGALEFFMINGFNVSASSYDSGFLSFFERVISFSFVEDISREYLRYDDEDALEDSWKEIVRQLMRERTKNRAT